MPGSTDVSPFPTFVLVIRIGYPGCNVFASAVISWLLLFLTTAVYSNLSAGPPPLLVVWVIPVIIPV